MGPQFDKPRKEKSGQNPLILDGKEKNRTFNFAET
jgi:hypothetical protein